MSNELTTQTKRQTQHVIGELLSITGLQEFYGAYEIGLKVKAEGSAVPKFYNLRSTNKADLENIITTSKIAPHDIIEFEADGKTIVENKVSLIEKAQTEEYGGLSDEDRENKELLGRCIDEAIEMTKLKKLDDKDGNWSRFIAGSLNVDRRMRRR